jgi:hypothetical protein
MRDAPIADLGRRRHACYISMRLSRRKEGCSADGRRSSVYLRGAPSYRGRAGPQRPPAGRQLPVCPTNSRASLRGPFRRCFPFARALISGRFLYSALARHQVAARWAGHIFATIQVLRVAHTANDHLIRHSTFLFSHKDTGADVIHTMARQPIRRPRPNIQRARKFPRLLICRWRRRHR